MNRYVSGNATLLQDSDAIKLFVGQIPKHMEEDDLRPVFEEFGEIFDLAVIRDKISGLHRGERCVQWSLRWSHAAASYSVECGCQQQF